MHELVLMMVQEKQKQLHREVEMQRLKQFEAIQHQQRLDHLRQIYTSVVDGQRFDSAETLDAVEFRLAEAGMSQAPHGAVGEANMTPSWALGELQLKQERERASMIRPIARQVPPHVKQVPASKKAGKSNSSSRAKCGWRKYGKKQVGTYLSFSS